MTYVVHPDIDGISQSDPIRNVGPLKDRKIKSDFKMKNTIGDGMKMFQKYQLVVWRSIQNFYSHFTKVTRN
jgi:hypothetical protein